MAANRRDPGAVAADVALEQQQVDEQGDVLEAVGVLGQPHAVDPDDAVGLDIDLRGRFDVGTRQTRCGLDLVPRRVANLGFESLEPIGVLLDEGHVEHAFAFRLGLVVGGEDMLADAEHHRDVAADLDLMVLTADPGFLAGQHLRRILRVDEGLQPFFPHRVEGDDLHAALGRILQRMQETRTVRAGVLAEEEHRIAIRKVIVDDGADPDADDLLQRDRRRFVAHVGAVGQVVVAVQAREQGIEVGCLEAGAAGGIEDDGFGIERPELGPDGAERFVPFAGNVVVGRGVVAHRMGQAALLLQIIVVPVAQFA